GRAAFINGNLNLASASRTFTVANGLVGADLVINAAVSGGSAVQLIKEGQGTLSLTGNNVYDGQTVINNGVLLAASNTALGTNTGNTLVNAGGTLQLAGSSPLNITEIIVLNGSGFANQGALVSTGNNTLNVNLELQSDSVISTPSGTLTAKEIDSSN